MIQRRDFLLGSSALLLAGYADRLSAAPAHRLGLVDITVSRELAEDYARTLSAIADLGYSDISVRLAGHGGRDAGEPEPLEKAKLIRNSGLEVGVVRLGVRSAEYDKEIGIAADMGAKIVSLSIAEPFITGPVYFETSRAEFDRWLPKLASMGEMAKERGLKLAFHNHPHDFALLDGDAPIDIIAAAISPEIVSFEFDLAWIWYAGLSPAAVLSKYRDRVVSMHWKDVDLSQGTERSSQAVAVGDGQMNYATLLQDICELVDVTPYIEVDKPSDGILAAKRSANFVRKHGCPNR